MFNERQTNVNDNHVNNLLDILQKASNNIINLAFIALKSELVFNERKMNVKDKHVNNLLA